MTIKRVQVEGIGTSSRDKWQAISNATADAHSKVAALDADVVGSLIVTHYAEVDGKHEATVNVHAVIHPE